MLNTPQDPPRVETTYRVDLDRTNCTDWMEVCWTHGAPDRDYRDPEVVVSLHTHYGVWVGTDREEWKTESTATHYGVALSELEEAVRALQSVCDRIRAELR